MKRFIALFAVVSVALAGASVFADDKGDDMEEKKSEPMCCMFLEQAKEMLTKEQMEKAQALHAECLKEKCSEEAQATFFDAVKDILTPEQVAACKERCTKELILDCPICGGVPMCCYFLAKYEVFTEGQKTKAEELHKECAKAGCTEESAGKFFAACKAMLSDEQIAQCKANCQKEGIQGCPICGGAEEMEEEMEK